MNSITRIAFACLVGLAACGQPLASAPANTEATAPPTEGIPAAQMLVGRWGDSGDCTKDVVFNADGTFSSYTGGTGAWTLDGDLLTMTGEAGPMQVHVAIANDNTLMIGQPDGAFGMSQRC
jgi:hypothetical protein